MRQRYLSDLDKEVKGIIDDIRHNLTDIELGEISDEGKRAVIDWLSTARSAVENAAFHVKD